MNQIYRRIFILLSVLFSVSVVFGQTPEFTYQGKLTDTGGSAANYDFEFRLCATLAADCTTPLATFSQPNVPVSSGGIFTTKINFGSTPFDGSDRFLEITVRRAGETNYTTLAPRQKMTSAPYAIQTLKANDALQLGGTAANQYVLTSDPRLSATNYVQNGTTAQTGVNFNVGGTGTANVFNAGAQFNLGGQRILRGDSIGNTFLGISNGISNTSGANNTFAGFFAGRNNTSGSSNTFFGVSSGTSNTEGRGNAFFGTSSGSQNMTGDNNSFFGTTAGQNTTGNSNSFFGYGAGVFNATGTNNTAVGANSGLSANNLSFATAIGAGATAIGNNSVTLGRAVDQVYIPGSMYADKFISAQTYINATTAYYQSGRLLLNNTGANNIFLGTNGTSNTTGARNLFLGDSAGSLNTTGSDNIFIGYNSGTPNATQVSNSIAVGNNATVSTSNTIVLGTTNQKTVIRGNLQIFAGRTDGGGTAFESVTTTLYGPGLATTRLYLSSISNPVYTQSPICFSGSSGGEIPYGIVGYCANGTGLSENKTDLKTFSGGLETIKRLKPVSFKWKTDGVSGIGLNADDVAVTDPQLVSRDEKGKVREVSESGLNAVLINAIKEQQKQIEEQSKQIDELKKIVCAANPSAQICQEKKDEK